MQEPYVVEAPHEEPRPRRWIGLDWQEAVWLVVGLAAIATLVFAR
jgi:hypothetical protein